MFIFKGIHCLQKWCDLPTILQKDRKKILPSEGEGISLIESIITCLWEGYDIGIGYSKRIQFLATEISSKPAYTKYMKNKPSLDDIIFNLTLKEKDEYVKYAAELYIPAISDALDLHLGVIKYMAGYYGVVYIFPGPGKGNPKEIKTITLIRIDDNYYPVVHADVPEGKPQPGLIRPLTQMKSMSVTPVKPEEVMVISDTDYDSDGGELVNAAQLSPVMIGSQVTQVNEEQQHPDIYMELLKEVQELEEKLKKQSEEEWDFPVCPEVNRPTK